MYALSNEDDRKAFRKKEKRIGYFVYISLLFAILAQNPFTNDNFFKDTARACNILFTLFLVIEFVMVHKKMMKYHMKQYQVQKRAIMFFTVVEASGLQFDNVLSFIDVSSNTNIFMIKALYGPNGGQLVISAIGFIFIKKSIDIF